MIEKLATTKAPAAIGPYSQGVKAGGLVFVSGQMALDPATGEFVPGDIKAQTVQVLKNIQAILAAAGLDLANVTKTTIFLTDMQDFAQVNEAYANAFSGHAPARSTVQVAALPKGARIEIEAIACA